MTVTLDQFLADDRYAEFSSDFSDETIAAILAEAADDLPSDVWLNLKDRATKLLACHRLTTKRNAAEGGLGVAIAGNLTSLSVSQGNESVSFSGGTGDRDSDPEGLMDTVCGREFLKLRSRIRGRLTGFVP
ncbi:MAG: DUF4054 domain-containing protein [Leptodesmis sp.]|uniref:DUF4054 domain-containing protein n=1 Tax=Leptodesmis sp. TaxID=3100501 RepID=UPI003D106B74